MNFSKQLKEQRVAKGLSQEQLAENLHIARQSISKWERGEAYPSIGMLIRLSELFDMSIDELLKGDTQLKDEIVKSGEKVSHPRLKLFFDWLFLTGVALMTIRVLIALAVRFEVVDWEVEFIRGWLPALITFGLLVIGGVGSDTLKKDVRA